MTRYEQIRQLSKDDFIRFFTWYACNCDQCIFDWEFCDKHDYACKLAMVDWLNEEDDIRMDSWATDDKWYDRASTPVTEWNRRIDERLAKMKLEDEP